jgi:hypothetical protein
MESCVNPSTATPAPEVVFTGSDFVYVCLNCGRRSHDPQGYHPLTNGWGRSCSKAAARLPSHALQVDAQGLVCSIRKEAVTALRREASAALN